MAKKKRYHQSKADRRREHSGMERYERGPVKSHAPHHFSDEFYAGMDSRRKQEMEDAGYLHEDRREVANLPQNVIMRPYPKTGPWLPEGLNDTITGIDYQMDMDDRKRREHFVPKKV